MEESGEKELQYTQFWWPLKTFTILPTRENDRAHYSECNISVTTYMPVLHFDHVYIVLFNQYLVSREDRD